MNENMKRLFNGLIKENPTFVLMLGMCPTLAVTTSAINGLGMGLSTTVVLIFANLIISIFRKQIPDGVRIPAFIVIVASLVTIVEFLMKAYLQALSESLGVYIPLIVVNCLILGRAESFASKNGPLASIADGLGMGIGYTLTMALLALIRGVIGNGTIEFFDWTIQVLPESFTIDALTTAMGAFIVFAILLATINRIKFYKADKLAKDEVNK